MSKRKFDDLEADNIKPDKQTLKNSLDSDEDDDETNEDTYNVMNEDDFEGIYKIYKHNGKYIIIRLSNNLALFLTNRYGRWTLGTGNKCRFYSV